MNKHFNKDGKARNDSLSAVLGDACALGSAQWLVGMTHRRPKAHLLSFQAFVILTSFHVELPYEPICVSAGVIPYHPVYSGYGDKGEHSCRTWAQSQRNRRTPHLRERSRGREAKVLWALYLFYFCFNHHHNNFIALWIWVCNETQYNTYSTCLLSRKQSTNLFNILFHYQNEEYLCNW